MSENYVFILILSIFSFFIIIWGIKNLPQEKWQFIAAIPRNKNKEDSSWDGINLTYYGLFNANSYTISVLIFLILTSSMRISPLKTTIIAFLILAICIPASKIVARIVEKKQGTLTIGGASFVGIIITPFVITLLNTFIFAQEKIPLLPLLASISISYTFGESLGRLACLSFGCCYGKRIDECSSLIQKIFKNFYHVFHGSTKKISYASNWEGERVIPIQSITSFIYLFTGIISLVLFFNSQFTLSLLFSVSVTQLWRVYSETLRADFRGNTKISAYQIMAILSICYVLILTFIYKSQLNPKNISVTYSFEYLYNVPVLIFLQSLWIITFIWTGKSIVTSSKIKFFVNHDKI